MEPPPERASGSEALGGVSDSGYERARALVRRADGQTIQLTPLLYELFGLVDGRRDHAELADALGVRVGKSVTADDVRYLIEEKLRPLGLLRGADGVEPETQAANPLLALTFKAVVSNPAVTSRIAAPFAALFRPWIAVPVFIAFLGLSAWMVFAKGLGSAFHQALYQPEFLLLVLGLTVLSAGFHELGHAAACRYGGVKPGAMGVGLYLVWPAFYTDVSGSYRLDRRDRLRVDLGGLYFNAIFALGILGAWALLDADALLLVIAAQMLQMVRQLIPIVRFDGYHILADLVGVPDLFHHIKPTLLRLIPWRRKRPEDEALKPWARWIVTAWVLAVVPLLIGIFALLVLLFPRLVATAWDSLGLQADGVAASWAEADVAGVVLSAFKIVVLALPVAGIAYMISRVVRRTAAWGWRSTADSPARRTAAVALASLLVTGVAWAWWPGDQYRPIESGERLTLLSAGAGSPATDGVSLVPASAQGQEGEWQLVLLPQDMVDEAGATPVTPPDGQEWPFPFDPPAEAGEGDNQASSVNTTDGSTEYNVALALVWVTDGKTVDNQNEAFALASCTDCKTVAVAFQAVIVIGYAQTVTPVNHAVAINYACASCETHALAVQLVTMLSEPPTEAMLEELSRIWAELEQLSDDFELMPIEQVYAVIASAQDAILAALGQEAPVEPGSDGSVENPDEPAGADPATTTTDDSAPSEGTTTGPDDGTADDETTTPTTTGG